MADAVFAALPADAAILVAAVADWRVEASPTKLKKGDGPPQAASSLPTRDILAELGASPQRPRLLVGFAAETERVVEQAIAKRIAKRADWIVANDVSGDVMGGRPQPRASDHRRRRRGLAGSEQGRGRAAADRPRLPGRLG